MRNNAFSPGLSEFNGTVSDADLVGFHHPREIVHDPLLTLARKRQLVSYWLSDIHAVPGSPALRRHRFGSTVPVDELFAALSDLGGMVDFGALTRGSGEGVAA